MKSEKWLAIDNARKQNQNALVNRRGGAALRSPTQKEQDFLANLRPSAKITMARKLLSMPPASHFKDDVPEQSQADSQVQPEQLLDEDIISYLDTSVLFDSTKSLAQIISDERTRLAALPKQATPQQIEQLQELNPAARIAEARRLGVV